MRNRVSVAELVVAGVLVVTAAAFAGAVTVAGLLIRTGWLRHHGNVNAAARDIAVGG